MEFDHDDDEAMSVVPTTPAISRRACAPSATTSRWRPRTAEKAEGAAPGRAWPLFLFGRG